MAEPPRTRNPGKPGTAGDNDAEYKSYRPKDKTMPKKAQKGESV
jgi:hypothetical protein